MRKSRCAFVKGLFRGAGLKAASVPDFMVAALAAASVSSPCLLIGAGERLRGVVDIYRVWWRRGTRKSYKGVLVASVAARRGH